MTSSNEAVEQVRETSRIVEDILTESKALSRDEVSARERLISKARDLISILETPVEMVTWIAWAEVRKAQSFIEKIRYITTYRKALTPKFYQPTRNLATRVAINLGLFDKLKDAGAVGKTNTQLAEMANADPQLVSRVLKHLAAMGMIAEIEADTYKANKVTQSMAEPRVRDGIPFCFDCAGPSFLNLPNYLAETGYRNPNNVLDGPFQAGHKTKQAGFEWVAEHPAIAMAFGNHMAGYRQGRPSWMDPNFYPVTDRLANGFKEGKDAVLLVDVGGGIGHDLEEFYTKHPDLPGRLVLQERPEVVAQIGGQNPVIEPTVHDFFTSQPIKGARAYYMHSVLHDWTDDDSRKILRQLIPAMEKGYSKILINENIVPDVGASWKTTALDFFMMALAASAERTEAQWRALLESVGLKVTGIWTVGQGTESLIEATLED